MSYATPPPLPAVSGTAAPITVVGPQFMVTYPFNLKMTMKLMTLRDGSFTVTDDGNNVMFKVRGSIISLHDTRRVFDSTNRPLLTLRHEIITLHSRWKVYRGDSSEENDLLFTVKKSSVLQFNIQLDVFLAQNTDQEVPDFKITESTIYVGDSRSTATATAIAEINKERTFQSIVLGKDKFVMTVYPNVDYAFVVGLLVVLSAQRGFADVLKSVLSVSVGMPS